MRVFTLHRSEPKPTEVQDETRNGRMVDDIDRNPLFGGLVHRRLTGMRIVGCDKYKILIGDIAGQKIARNQVDALRLAPGG